MIYDGNSYNIHECAQLLNGTDGDEQSWSKCNELLLSTCFDEKVLGVECKRGDHINV